jgi:hypothetical protein
MPPSSGSKSKPSNKPAQRRLQASALHDVLSLKIKMIITIVNAVRTSNAKQIMHCLSTNQPNRQGSLEDPTLNDVASPPLQETVMLLEELKSGNYKAHVGRHNLHLEVGPFILIRGSHTENMQCPKRLLSFLETSLKEILFQFR